MIISKAKQQKMAIEWLKGRLREVMERLAHIESRPVVSHEWVCQQVNKAFTGRNSAAVKNKVPAPTTGRRKTKKQHHE